MQQELLEQRGPGFWSLHSVRLKIVFLLAFGFAVHATIRGVMSMALVCMIPEYGHHQLNKTTVVNRSFQVDWDLREISAIFMFFYAGNFLSVFGTHYFTLKFGTKHIISYGILVSVVATWAIPILIYLTPNYIFTSVLRLITGIAQGFYIPCASLLVSKWFPEHEKSSAMAIFTTGNQIGLAISMYFTAEFCEMDFMFGWPLSFIAYGFLGVLFLLLWVPYATNQPRQSSQITAAELSVIHDKQQSASAQTLASIKNKTPYTKLLFSPAILSICVCSFCQSFTIVIISSYLPTLYRSALNLELTQNAIWSAVPFVVQILSKIIFGVLADFAKRKQVDVDLITKLSNSIASFGPAVLFLFLGWVEDKTLVLVLLSASLAFIAGYVPGYNTSIVCVAPVFTSAISAYAQGFAQVASILGPIFVGFATEESSFEEWLVVFKVMAVILILTGLFFLIFGSAKIQPWALPSSLHKTTALKSLDKSAVGITQLGSSLLIEEAANNN